MKKAGVGAEVDVYAMRHDISSIPGEDCTAMRSEGIMEPIAYLYWQAYNDYISQHI